jgi:hypothetical protein
MATAIVGKAVDAAHAHAVVALTDTLKRTPDGRKTIRRAANSPSFVAACNRLDELWERLTGTSTASLGGLIRDGRADFYAQAYRLWKGWFPAEFATDEGISNARLNEMRGLVLHGMEVRVEIGAKILDARRSLLATLERATRKSASDHVSTDLLDAWKVMAKSSITRSATVALADSQVAIDGIAGVDAVKPEHRPRNEFTPS